MSRFSNWFNCRYDEWKKSQPSEEDFLQFCEQLGYQPGKILSWFQGDSTPEGPEVLCLAGLFGEDVYEMLDLPRPDPEILKVFSCFKQLNGQDRSRLAMAIFEAEKMLTENNLSPGSIEAKEIFSRTFNEYGL